MTRIKLGARHLYKINRYVFTYHQSYKPLLKAKLAHETQRERERESKSYVWKKEEALNT